MSTYETGFEFVGEAPLQEWEFVGEQGEQEHVGEYAGEFPGGLAGELNAEMIETELAQEFLDVTNEAELEEFLGKLVRSAVRGVGSFMKSGPGKALGGVLKGVAKTALPIAGAALGSVVAPGIGTALGGKLGSLASGLLEVNETELLGEDEARMVAARRYVRFARGAVRNAAYAPRNLPPRVVARNAAIASARRYAPGLLRPRPRPTSPRWRDRRTARFAGYGYAPGATAWVQAPTAWDASGGAAWAPGWDAGPAAGTSGGSDWGAGGWSDGWDTDDPGDPYAGAGHEMGFELP